MTLQNDDLFLVNRNGDSFKTEYGLIKQNILIEAGGATVSETPPDDPSEGDFWYHPGTDILSIWVTDEVTGVVTSIGTRSAGSGYTSNATDVETTGGTGVELTVDIDAGVGGNFANPSINKGGHGYKTGDVVFITGAGHGNGSLQVTGINTVAVGEWEEISGSSVTSGPTFPPTGTENELFFNTTDGRLYIYNNSQWLPATPNSTSSPNPPSNPNTNDLWFDEDSGKLFIYHTDSDSSQWVETNPTTAPEGSVAGFRNVIINGAVTINQREKTYAEVANNEYWADRWKKVSGGMTQIIEDGNYEPNSTYTLSGFGVTTQQVTSPGVGHWTIPTIPETATKIQLELGSQVTPFERRPITTELNLCQRYFQLISCINKNVGKSGRQQYVSVKTFATEMRIQPTTGQGPGYVQRIFAGEANRFCQGSSNLAVSVDRTLGIDNNGGGPSHQVGANQIVFTFDYQGTSQNYGAMVRNASMDAEL